MKKILRRMSSLLLLFIVACSGGNESAQDSENIATVEFDQSEAAMDNEMAQEDDSAAEEGESGDQAVEKAERTDQQRKIIYNAQLTIEVRAFSAAEKDIEKLVQEKKGYIVNSNVTRFEDERRNGSITARIPQDAFQPFLDQVADIGSEVKEKSTNSEDVTEEYVDLDARLKAKQAVKKRLDQFMEEAETTEDLLAVSEQLAKVQEDIEQLQGRINYLENQSDYATVTISIKERSLKAGDIAAEDLNTWAKAKQLFVATVNTVISGISGLMVVVIGLSPIIVPVVIIVSWIVYARWKKKRENERADRE